MDKMAVLTPKKLLGVQNTINQVELNRKDPPIMVTSVLYCIHLHNYLHNNKCFKWWSNLVERIKWYAYVSFFRYTYSRNEKQDPTKNTHHNEKTIILSFVALLMDVSLC